MNLADFIHNALNEDIGSGDHTSNACIDTHALGKAKLIAKESGVLAGVRVAKEILKTVEKNINIVNYIEDGKSIHYGDLVFEIEGKAQAILKAERLMLNCMQRMSGIATLTSKYVETVKGLPVKILDTRKTTPGFRLLEKEAVKIGGGTNHRFGLFDMIMIKDNHVDFCGGITKAIELANEYIKKNNLKLKIEVEARNMEEVKEIIETKKADRIMLDNFSLSDLKIAVMLIDGKIETEASGGITLETVRAYAECGVDYISVGALTHGAKSLDLSLLVS